MSTSSPSKLPRARDLQRLDHQLCFALYSSSLVMTKLYKPVLGALGLTYPQYLVLLVLWETDAIGVGVRVADDRPFIRIAGADQRVLAEVVGGREKLGEVFG
ncbi:MAG: MarR family transcriptional regulator, partial [Pseudomonadota bacterium]